MQTHMAVITSVDVQQQAVVPTLKPFDQELGWLPCLFGAREELAGKEAIVVATETFGQALVIPLDAGPFVGVIRSVSPLTVEHKGVVLPCRGPQIGDGALGKDALVVPARDQLVLTVVME